MPNKEELKKSKYAKKFNDIKKITDPNKRDQAERYQDNVNTLKKLKRLLTSNVYVRHITNKDGKNKTIDTDHISHDNILTNNPLYDNAALNSITGKNSYWENISFGSNSTRLNLFRDYEQMDRDPIIASALDLYSEETTIKNEYGEVLTINSPNEEIKEVLTNLYYEILNVEFNLPLWIRNMCKYGDFFLYLDIHPELGIIQGIPLSVYDVERIECDSSKESQQSTLQIGANNVHYTYRGINEPIESYNMADFRMMTDSNFLPYGRSVIEGTRKIWKQLVLMEDAMLIHRIMRAPEKRIFKIDVGNLPPNEMDNFMNQIINKIRKVPYVDKETGEYNLKFNMQNMIEDFFLPVRGGESATEIDTLGGLDYAVIDDIEYLRNKLMASLRIPGAFLGYDEAISGKATLASEDLRFARTVEKIQRFVESELYRIGVIQLYLKGYTDEDLVNFDIKLTNSSIIYEEEKIALLDSRAALAGSLKDLSMFSEDWIYENVFNLSDEDIILERMRLIKNAKFNYRLEQVVAEGTDSGYISKEDEEPINDEDTEETGELEGDEDSVDEIELDDEDTEEDTPKENKKPSSGERELKNNPLGLDKKDPFGIKDYKRSKHEDYKPLRHKNSKVLIEKEISESFLEDLEDMKNKLIEKFNNKNDENNKYSSTLLTEQLDDFLKNQEGE